jgi:hypothetical protein
MTNDDTEPAAQQASGSRWEQPIPPPAQPAPVPTYASAPPPRSGRRGRLLLAGGAVGIALVAGTGGFALGHASADHGRDGPGRVGGPGFPNFPGGGPMGGPQGTFPGQGQPPGGFPDRRDDDAQGDQPDDQPDDQSGDGATQGSPTT